jgi:hypothetical protein
MTTQETTEKKIVSKHSGVLPTAWHITPYLGWHGYVSIDGEMTFTKKLTRAKRELSLLFRS